jgi:hypothetical protein
MIILSLSIAVAAATALIGLAVLASLRVGGQAVTLGLTHGATPLALVFAGACIACAVASDGTRRDLDAERRAVDARVVDLIARATTPRSALACLDAIAGETVEASCERAVFLTPEATAIAVSYVSAQISLLSDLDEHVRRIGGREPAAFASLRRSIEGDRFGIVAHVLSYRDGCTAADCPVFGLLKNTDRLVANLNEAPYDLYVSRYADRWPAVTRDPVVGAADNADPEDQPAEPGNLPDGGKVSEGGKAAVAGKPAGGIGGPLVFPSSDSIPAVSIMNAEPAVAPPPATTGATPKQAAPKRAAAPAAAKGKQPPQQKAAAPGPVNLNPNAQAGADGR